MLNNTGFDQWADEYDRSVARSDAAGSYPFAGYQEILDEIVRQVTEHGGGDVLDIGSYMVQWKNVRRAGAVLRPYMQNRLRGAKSPLGSGNSVCLF